MLVLVKEWRVFKSIKGIPEKGGKIDKGCIAEEAKDLATAASKKGHLGEDSDDQAAWKVLALIFDRTLFVIWSGVIVIHSLHYFPRYN